MQHYKCDACGTEVNAFSDKYREDCEYCDKGKYQLVVDQWDWTSPYDRRVTLVTRDECHEKNKESTKKASKKKKD